MLNFPDFIREFPGLTHNWLVRVEGKFLMYMNLSYVDVAVIMLAYKCVVDTKFLVIDLA